MDNANLQGAIFAGATLDEASISGAFLEEVDFAYASLTRANQSSSDLTRANFRNAKLTNADLSNTILVETVMFQADLVGALFDEAHLYHADILGAIGIRLGQFGTATITENAMLQNIDSMIVDVSTACNGDPVSVISLPESDLSDNRIVVTGIDETSSWGSNHPWNQELTRDLLPRVSDEVTLVLCIKESTVAIESQTRTRTEHPAKKSD